MLHRRRDNVGPKLLNGFLFVGGQAHRRQVQSPIFRIRFIPYVGTAIAFTRQALPRFRKKAAFGACGGIYPMLTARLTRQELVT
jgi:hypothetical protein